MDLNTFIEQVAEQFDDLESQLSAETKFKELNGYSSLVALLIITMIDEEYDVTISGDDIRSVSTIAELFERVSSKK